MNPNGRKLRSRSVDSMIAELESLVAKGYDWFEFDDEIFGANQKFCTALLERMIETGLNERMNFYVLAHARFLNKASVSCWRGRAARWSDSEWRQAKKTGC
jgi:hypothetical protein